MASKNFKVIVVGGGPVGLTAAHALTHAKIDFVVLERRPSIVELVGASLVLLPHGMRVLGQLGLFDGLKSISTPLNQVTRGDHNGKDIGIFGFFEHLKQNHGEYPVVLSRFDLTKLLYGSLPAESQSCMLPNKKVSEITNTANGVVVNCADGTSYEGSIVIGADGAHSEVRSQMNLLAQQTSPAQGAALNTAAPYLTTYRALWFRFPTSLGLRPGQVHEAHGNGLGTQMFAGDDTAVVAAYERLERPTRERPRYTQADQDALVERWANVPIAHGLTLKKAFDARLSADLVDLEEGVVEYWSSGRMVLAGDAAHKYTPSTGSGCNTGIIDVVVLVNELRKIINPEHGNNAPSEESIAAAFKTYQDTRYGLVTAGCKASAGATATATWQNTALKLFDKYVLPNATLQKFLAEKGASTTAQSPIFDFIGGSEQMTGKVPWTQSIMPKSALCA